MKISIHQPAGFNEIGGRSNNEDSIYPAPGKATISDRLFMVCDGVGGEHKGEVASFLACKHIGEFFSQTGEVDVSKAFVQKAVDTAREAFIETEKNDPETAGMATTLTLLYFDDSGAILAHLGDSRIYHIRNGKVIFQTKDHKWVNELVESGVITEAQATQHPQRNVITKVITASRSDEADYMQISDIQAGDFFFLCSDGVLEQLYDDLLEYHLRDNPDNHPEPIEILEAIKTECAHQTNDNFSAYLIRIESVMQQKVVEEKVNEKVVNAVTPEPVISQRPLRKPRGVLFGLITFAGIFCSGLIYHFVRSEKQAQKAFFESKVDVNEVDTAQVKIPARAIDVQEIDN
ncbi:protein phosphatase 2C domain-containing protein [Dyadobacter chenwenxiniae]|uniref:Protein phosphatase 2C domain-containing protein n=1 Tax=Dyadobacter chenwenxiniae TaxID=2906456 RepID=A0A9X1TCY9_9BACT|nr:protein phosphatase 2C domain-containing protein [Dyadobacter chenwenxiniae]MCF0060642.1 protein phosphatase 2C domain-containing protein [Dyadobacter chenwenxiniae]UON80474.1 protein phosphatase 2C domain-containing protein [Dyadobacter chenwenxiniae]